MKRSWTYLASLAVLLPLHVFGQTRISVNVKEVLNDVSRHPLGINVNYLTDEPQNTARALSELGVNFLRYPGGEKADNYLWSEAPWSKAKPKFAREGKCEWPSGDSNFAEVNWTTPKASTLDFDEFMVMARTVKAEPLIVVAYDSMYKKVPDNCTVKVPTREQLLKNAVEWVRYANVIKKHKIKYWMIGNESYNDSYNGRATAEQYRSDLIEFSRQMKAIDPDIKIVANGDSEAWWATVLPTAAPYIDVLGISNYPFYDFVGGYDYYKKNTPDFIKELKQALSAIEKYAPTSDRERLTVLSSECNAIDWNKKWKNTNDLGHALATFEMLGEHLKHPKIEGAYLWSTRWVNDNDPIFSALKKDGSLAPNGLALSIWGHHLLDKMVSTTSTPLVRTFASYRHETNELNLYLINKDGTSQSTLLSLSGYVSRSLGETWQLTGKGPEDLSPVWKKVGPVSLVKNSLSLSLPPYSITMIKLRPTALVETFQGNITTLELKTAQEKITDTIVKDVASKDLVAAPISLLSDHGSSLPGPKIYYGAFAPDLATFEANAGKKVAIINSFKAWGGSSPSFNPRFMNEVRGHGSIPMITWEPWRPGAGVDQPAFSLLSIIRGDHDAYIKKFANEAKAWGKPFFIRFAHEMNGNWYPWSEGVNGNAKGTYVKAWRHVVDLFKGEGVSNVTWAWVPNKIYKGSVLLSGLYPGDDYVHWTGLDTYNKDATNFRSLRDITKETYDEIIKISPAKPMMIAETSSLEEGGSKPEWIMEGLKVLPVQFPQIKALIWFNQNKSRPWAIESSSSSQAAFARAISSGDYAGNSYGNLITSPIRGPGK